MCFAPHVPCPVHTGGGATVARTAAAAASASTGGSAAGARTVAAAASASTGGSALDARSAAAAMTFLSSTRERWAILKSGRRKIPKATKWRSGSQRGEHAWLVGREGVSASVSGKLHYIY